MVAQLNVKQIMNLRDQRHLLQTCFPLCDLYID